MSLEAGTLRAYSAGVSRRQIVFACVVLLGCGYCSHSHTVDDCWQVLLSPRSEFGSGNYVGLRYRSLPDDFESVAGMLLPEDALGRKYGLSYLAHGKKEMLWLERVRKLEDQPYFEVRAVLELPNMGVSDRFLTQCGFGGQPHEVDYSLTLAIAVDEDKEVLRKIKHAWHVSLSSERFIPLPENHVWCINEGYYAIQPGAQKGAFAQRHQDAE